jgi:hypothetical protein
MHKPGHLVLAEDDLRGAANEVTDDPRKDLRLDTNVGSSSGRHHVRPYVFPPWYQHHLLPRIVPGVIVL